MKLFPTAGNLQVVNNWFFPDPNAAEGGNGISQDTVKSEARTPRTSLHPVVTHSALHQQRLYKTASSALPTSEKHDVTGEEQGRGG